MDSVVAGFAPGCLHAESVPVAARGGGGEECLVCATAVLSSDGSRAHVRALVSRLRALNPEKVRSLVVAGPHSSVILGLVDALCAALAREAPRGDSDLVLALAEAAAHISVACDTGDERCVPSLRTSDVTRAEEYPMQVCTAVLAHALGYLEVQPGEKVSNPKHPSDRLLLRGAFVRLIAFVLRLSSNDGDASMPSLELLTALRDILCDMSEVDVVALLEDLESVHSRNMGVSLGCTVDVLSAFVASSSAYICQCLAEHLGMILKALSVCKEDSDRVKVLDLILLVLPMLSTSETSTRFETGAESQLDAAHKIGTSDRSLCAQLLLDNLKLCILSESLLLLARVKKALEFVVEAKLSSSSPFYNVCVDPSGLVDYILEALRPFGESKSCPSSRPAGYRANELAVALLGILSILLEHNHIELRTKWSFGLPIVLRVANSRRNFEVLDTSFHIVRRALEGTDTFCALNSENVSIVFELIMHCGSEILSLHENGADWENDKRIIFEKGLQAAGVLLERGLVTSELYGLLFEAAECIAVVAPDLVSGAQIARNVVDHVLDSDNCAALSENMEKVRNLFLGTWGDVCIDAYQDANSCESRLVSLLQVVSSSLDPRMFENEASAELSSAVCYFWNRLPPKLVFARLDLSQARGVGVTESAPKSSDMFYSFSCDHGESERDDCGSQLCGAYAGTPVRTSRGAVQLYLTRICARSSFLSLRETQKFMPGTILQLMSTLQDVSGPEAFHCCLLLLESGFACGSDVIAPSGDILRCLYAAADREEILSEMFSECVLPFLRALFKYSKDSRGLGRPLVLPKSLCEISLKKECLALPQDEDLILHLISSHETPLRMTAWRRASQLLSLNNEKSSAFRGKLGTIIAVNTAAAKTLAACFLEKESQGIAALTLNLVTASDSATARSLIRVGLPSVAICAFERYQQCVSKETGSMDERQMRENGFVSVAKVLTVCIGHSDFEDIQRALLVFVNWFSYQTGELAYSETNLQILRCCAVVFNGALGANPRYTVRTERVSYLNNLMNSAVLSRLRDILALLGRDRGNDGCTNVAQLQRNNLYNSIRCLAATVLDYTLRVKLILERSSVRGTCEGGNDFRSTLDTCSIYTLKWDVLLSTEAEAVNEHGAFTRSAACLQLLTTVFIGSSRIPDGSLLLLDSVVSHAVLVKVISMCVARPFYLGASALRLVVACCTVKADHQRPSTSPDNLASFRALWKVVWMKISTAPEFLSPEEYEFLAGSAYYNSLSSECVHDALSKLVALEKKGGSVSDSARSLLSSSVKRFLAMKLKNKGIKPSEAIGSESEKTVTVDLQRLRDWVSTVDSKSLPIWKADEILLGNRPIISAPLLLNSAIYHLGIPGP